MSLPTEVLPFKFHHKFWYLCILKFKSKNFVAKILLLQFDQFNLCLDQESILLNVFGINYIKIDVIQGKIQLVESIFNVIYGKICFIGLTPNQIKACKKWRLVLMLKNCWPY